MKKLLVLTLVLGLSIGLLAGCSGDNGNGGGNENVTVDEIIEAIKEQIIAGLRNQGYTDEDFEYEELPGYSIEDLTSDDLGDKDGLISQAKTIKAGFLNADEIFVIKANSGKANELKALLETYKQERYEFWADYNEMQAEKINNAIIKVKGDFVYYIVFEDAAAIETAVNEVLN